MPKLTALLTLAIFFALPTKSQPLDPSKELTQYNIDHWEDDRSPSSILQITQTSDGYLWMVTLKGIARFDGVKLTTFDRFSNPELKVNGFKSLFEDSKKRLWIGSIGGGVFYKQGNSFKQLSLPFGPSGNNVERIREDSKGRLWICTLRGLVAYQHNTFTLMKPQGVSDSIDFPVYDIAEDRNGTIWVATAQGLMELKDENLFPATDGGYKKIGEIMDLHITSDNTLWLASYSNGIYTYTSEGLKKVTVLDELKHPMVIHQDRASNIWVGSELGVARYRRGKASRLEAGRGLSHNNVTAIFEDHEGSIWLGTYYGGINRLRDGTFTNYTTAHGLTHNTVHAVFQTHDSTIWIGTETDLSYKSGDAFVRYSDKFPVLRDKRIRHVFEDSRENLWVASYDGLFQIRNNKLTVFNVKSGLSSDQARVIFEDSNGSVWVGTRQGLNQFVNGKWKIFSAKEGLLNDFVMSIAEPEKGTLLIGTTGGLFTLKDGVVMPLKIRNKTMGVTTFHVHVDTDRNLWVSTTNGLLLIKPDSIYAFSNEDLLVRNVYQVVEDKLGAFWITSDIGVVRVLKKDLLNSIASDTVKIHIRLFDKSSGLRTNEITAASKACQDMNGKIWIPTLEGLACVDPQNILVNTTPPPIALEKVLIGGKEYDWTQKISAPPNSRNIEIQYTGLSFMIPKKVKFKYKLTGYDKDWHEAGERRIAYYSALPPGDYTFSISASNNDGVWNKVDKVLALHVERAFWQTIPFYIFCTVLFVLLIMTIIHLRTRSVKRLNVRLEEKIRERTQEVLNQKEEIEAQRDYIEEKNHELLKARDLIEQQYATLREINENLELKVSDRTKELRQAYDELIAVNKELDDFVYKSAHDIKGPLARLQGLCNLALLESGSLRTREYLLKLQHESLLANRVIEKLGHSYEVKHHQLIISDVVIPDLVAEVIRQVRAAYAEESKDVAVKLRCEPDVNVRTDRKMLSQALYNLLENAIIFRSQKDPSITIAVEVIDDKAQISISDNGIGLDASIRDKVFKEFVKGSEKSQGLGLGLYIAKSAIELIGGKITLVDNNSLETEFRIEIPTENIENRSARQYLTPAARFSLD